MEIREQVFSIEYCAQNLYPIENCTLSIILNTCTSLQCTKSSHKIDNIYCNITNASLGSLHLDKTVQKSQFYSSSTVKNSFKLE